MTTPSIPIRTHFYIDDTTKIGKYDDVKRRLTTLAKEQPDTKNVYIRVELHQTQSGSEKIYAFSLNLARGKGQTVKAGITPFEAIEFISSVKEDKTLLSFGNVSGTQLDKKNIDKIVESVIELRATQLAKDHPSKAQAVNAATKELSSYLDEKSGGTKKFSSDVLAEITAMVNGVKKSEASDPKMWKERLSVLRSLQLGNHGDVIRSLGYDASKIHSEVAEYYMVQQKRLVAVGDQTEERVQYTLRKSKDAPSYTDENNKEHKMEKNSDGYYVDPRKPSLPDAKDGSIKVNYSSAAKTRELSEELQRARTVMINIIGEEALKRIPQNMWITTANRIEKK